MTRKEIQEMTDAQLLSAFYWNAVRATNEVNSKRGLTKKTEKEEQFLHEEIVKRFNLNPTEFKTLINR